MNMDRNTLSRSHASCTLDGRNQECCFRVGAGALAEARDALELDDDHNGGGRAAALLRSQAARANPLACRRLGPRPRGERLVTSPRRGRDQLLFGLLGIGSHFAFGRRPQRRQSWSRGTRRRPRAPSRMDAERSGHLPERLSLATHATPGARPQHGGTDDGAPRQWGSNLGSKLSENEGSPEHREAAWKAGSQPTSPGWPRMRALWADDPWRFESLRRIADLGPCEQLARRAEQAWLIRRLKRRAAASSPSKRPRHAAAVLAGDAAPLGACGGTRGDRGDGGGGGRAVPATFLPEASPASLSRQKSRQKIGGNRSRPSEPRTLIASF